MPVPKFKTENLHLFAFGAALWLALLYAAIEIIGYAADYLLSLINLFFHH
ncbi:hypothetical protein [Mucilaginibacter sp.]